MRLNFDDLYDCSDFETIQNNLKIVGKTNCIYELMDETNDLKIAKIV
jgi:hypothetical protein